MSTTKSYLTSLAILLLMLAVAPGIGAQSIYLTPGSNYITTGVGTEFELELWVDADITSIRSFVYQVSFDVTKLDTVFVTQGPLLPSVNGVAATVFEKYIEDGTLKIQDLLLGAGLEASGPGLLATVRLRVIGTGVVNLEVTKHKVRDVDAVLLETDAFGANIYIDVVPNPFDLLSPIGGATMMGLPGDPLAMDWTASATVYPGENVTYRLEYSTTPDFLPGQTGIFPGITTSIYNLDVADLEWGYEGLYYWRVFAVGDLYGFERLCTPENETFDFAYDPVPPEPFDLIAPADASEISGVPNVDFDWTDASTIIPGDAVEYIFYVATDPGVSSGILVEIPVVASQAQIPVAGLPRNQSLYWKVAAVNTYDQTTWSTSTFSFTVPGCCVGRVGDANDSGEDEPTIGDVSIIIDVLYINLDWSVIPCLAEADINQSGGLEPIQNDITIGDVSYLVDYLFITGASLGLLDCF